MKTLGIIGGMGPLAGIDLLGKIIRMTQAAKDQDHIHVVLDSNPAIPDRSRAILRGEPSPLPQLIESAQRLIGAGADAIAMACNTAHYFHEPLQAAVSVPVLHMLRETAQALRDRGVRTAGLLATDGTVSTGIYPSILSEYGIDVIVPSEAGQREVMRLIYDDIKSGAFSMDTSALLRELGAMRARGAELFVLGCTELPIAFEHYGWDLPTADPTSILAEAVIRLAGKELKSR